MEEMRRMKIYVAVEIHRGLFYWVKGFEKEEDRKIFVYEWAKDNGFKDYEEYEKLIEEEGQGEVDNHLYLDEIEVQ
jgi:hypothetical protein